MTTGTRSFHRCGIVRHCCGRDPPGLDAGDAARPHAPSALSDGHPGASRSIVTSAVIFQRICYRLLQCHRPPRSPRCCEGLFVELGTYRGDNTVIVDTLLWWYIVAHRLAEGL